MPPPTSCFQRYSSIAALASRWIRAPWRPPGGRPEGAAHTMRKIFERSTGLLTRRQTLLALAGTGVASARALAQDGAGWIEQLLGIGYETPGTKGSGTSKPRSQKQVFDGSDGLKSGRIPMLSPAMADEMRAAIKRYEAIAANGGWRAIPPGPMLQLDAPDDRRIAALRQRLAVSGDIALDGPVSTGFGSFGTRLEEGLKRFQRRHGLPANGPGLSHLAEPAQHLQHDVVVPAGAFELGGQ